MKVGAGAEINENRKSFFLTQHPLFFKVLCARAHIGAIITLAIVFYGIRELDRGS